MKVCEEYEAPCQLGRSVAARIAELKSDLDYLRSEKSKGDSESAELLQRLRATEIVVNWNAHACSLRLSFAFMSKDLEPPRAGLLDQSHALVRAGFGSIPLAGAAAAELFNMIVAPPLERRRLEWMGSVADRLNGLERAGFLKVDDLGSNESFVTTVMQASQTALRNHQEEKLEALRNAVLNAALPNAPDESLQQMFLNFVDIFTVWHLRVLDLFHEPTQWFRRNDKRLPDAEVMGASRTQTIDAAYPELGAKGAFRDQVVSDLHSRGLMSIGKLQGTVSGGALLNKLTTGMGDEFLSFITAPKAVAK